MLPSGMMGVPVIAGWLMHFMIGITFAAGYIFVFYPLVKISNKYLKGALFGIAVFIFAQIAMMELLGINLAGVTGILMGVGLPIISVNNPMIL